MSMLSDILRSMLCLVAPPRCPICGGAISDENVGVCTTCELTAPLTNTWQQRENAMMERFWGLIPVEHASAFLWYIEGSAWREAIHRFKYKGAWHSAYNLGRWYGSYLKESGHYDDIDLVVPVPLHWLRRVGRGYNQSEYLADGIAERLGAKVDRHSLYRRRYNLSQTSRTRSERWKNVEGVFAVRNVEQLRGRHILLVDDVFTTGATIMSLAETILRAAPDARLSVATLAATPHSLNRKE